MRVKEERYQIKIDALTVDVVRKRMKTMRMKVYPPDGRVRVSAPRSVSDESVRDFVVRRTDWIREKQEVVRERHPHVPNEIVTGEIHLLQGRPRRLDVLETAGRRRVEPKPDGSISLFIRHGDSVDARRAILQEFYREALRAQLPDLIAKWEPIVGVEVAECRIKRMKTRWGSCNFRARRIWLNLELAKRPPACLEFVLVHEMVHFHERLHNRRFYAYMDRFMPGWQECRDELKRQAPVD